MNNSMTNLDLPIGVFDSGVGGLTVLHALQQELPHESFLYLGDTARLPYGTKSAENIVQFTQQAGNFLIQRGIKLLVIACNTASSLALVAMHETFKHLPIIGVVESGARAACAASKNGNIVVISTEATAKAGSYQQAIKAIWPQAQVNAQGCGLLVALAEEGWVEGPIAEAVAKRYLDPLLMPSVNYQPDCLVLGCTHFPILETAIKNVVNQQITVIDSAKTTAQTVAKTLQHLNLLRAKSLNAPYSQFLVTDVPERFARVAKHFLGIELDNSQIELVRINC